MMSNEMHNYQFGSSKVRLPRKWVPLTELEGIAVEFGFQKSSELENIFNDLGISLKKLPNGEKHTDFNGVSFYLLGKGIISAEFFCSILNYNFSDNYVPIVDIFGLLGEIMESIKNGPSIEEVNMVVSSLKRLVVT